MKESQLIAGRYRLIALLNVGGMGATFRAWDTTASVPVVIKMPKQELRNDAQVIDRFHREIEAMRSVPHESIVPITDSGEHEGCPFVVMRFLPGGSLADYRQYDDTGKPIPNPPEMVILWLPGIAAALDHIHSRGMLHRDVKPGNIFLDGFLKPYLGDFGIAKVVDDSGGLLKEATLTATQMTVGTPEYMAPELFSPNAVLDGRVDQYALGIVTYEMLCGEKPFTGATSHIIVEHSTLPVPRLERKRPRLPLGVCDAVYRALSKKPEDRFATCSDFAAAISAELAQPEMGSGTVRLLCPSCRNVIKLREHSAAKKGRCPRCKTVMQVAADLGSLWLDGEARPDSGQIDNDLATFANENEPRTKSVALSRWLFGLSLLLLPIVMTIGVVLGLVPVTLMHAFFGRESQASVIAAGCFFIVLLTALIVIVLARALASICRDEEDHALLYATTFCCGVAILVGTEMVFACQELLLPTENVFRLTIKPLLLCIALFVMCWGLPLRFKKTRAEVAIGTVGKIAALPAWIRWSGGILMLPLWLTWMSMALSALQQQDPLSWRSFTSKCLSGQPLSPDDVARLVSAGCYKFSRLTSPLGDEVAVQLARCRGVLELNGVKTIDVAEARALASTKAYRLALNGLEMLSDDTAKALAEYEGDLELNGLTSLSDTQARVLGARRGQLSLLGMKSISDRVAEALASSRHDGWPWLSLNTAAQRSSQADYWLSNIVLWSEPSH